MRPGGQVQALVFRRLRPVYGSLCWSVMCLPAWSLETWLVSWCFEPSQSQRIISGLEINFSPSPTYPDRLMALWAQSTTKDYIKAEKKKASFNLSPSHSVHKPSSHKFSRIYRVSADANSHKTYTYKHEIFEEWVPWVLPLFKKKKQQQRIRLGHTGIVDHSDDWSMPGGPELSSYMWLDKLHVVRQVTCG